MSKFKKGDFLIFKDNDKLNDTPQFIHIISVFTKIDKYYYIESHERIDLNTQYETTLWHTHNIDFYYKLDVYEILKQL